MDDILATNEVFTRGRLMTVLGPGGCDVISATMFLHLFDYANQLKAATRILRLLAHKPGSLVLGSQAGSTTPGEVPLKPPFAESSDEEQKSRGWIGVERREGKRTRRTVYRHNPQSFEELWKEAGRAAGVPLKVSAVFQAPDDFGRSKDHHSKGAKGRGMGMGRGSTDEGFDVEAKEEKRRDFAGVETRRLYFSVMRT